MYTELVPNMTLRQASTPLSLTAAAVIDRHIVLEGVQVNRIMIHTAVAIVSATPVVVAFKQRTAYGVTANQVTIGTITIPGGAAAGQIYYKELDPAKLLPGQELVVEVTAAAATSGTCFAGVKFGHSPETPFNVPVMIASV